MTQRKINTTLLAAWLALVAGCGGGNPQQVPTGQAGVESPAPDDDSGSDGDVGDASDFGADGEVADMDDANAGDNREVVDMGDAKVGEDASRSLAAWHEAQGVGLGAVILRGDEVVLSKGWGMAREGEAISSSTIFEIGSISKLYTAALVHDAVERGELAWDTPVHEVLDDFVASDEVRVEHLIRQTSGLFNYTESRAFNEKRHEPWTPRAVRDIFESKPLLFEPGEAFAYSNSNYFLAGVILERVTGKSFAELLRTRIAEPLGLKKTGMCDVDAVTTPRASGHRRGADGLSVIPSRHMSSAYAAGGVCSTPEEVAAFARAYYGGRWFSSQELETTPVFASGLKSPYSWATFVGRIAWRPTLSHGGSIYGFTSSLVRFPEQDMTVVLLSNVFGLNLFSAIEPFAEIIAPVDREDVVWPTVSESQAQAWAGVYAAPDLPPIEVIAEEEAGISLLVQGASFGLKRVGEADFETEPQLLRLRFNADILELEQNGVVFSLNKQPR